LKEEEKSVL